MVIFSTTVIIFILNWFYLSEKKISWAGEMNYAYLNIVRNHREVIEFTNTNFPLERVISHYPLNSAFFYPSAGYVNERQRRIIEDLDLQSFSVFKGVLIVSDFFVKEDKWEKIRNSKKLRLVREVKNRGIKTEIYKVY